MKPVMMSVEFCCTINGIYKECWSPLFDKIRMTLTTQTLHQCAISLDQY